MKRGVKCAGVILMFGLLSGARAAEQGEVITDLLTVNQTGSVYGVLSILKGNVVTNGASLYFDFDTNESGVVTDRSGSGNHGAVSGAVWTSSGYIQGAYDFNGTNQWIAVPGSSSLNLTTAITVSAWVKFKGEGVGNHVFLMKHTLNYIQYGLLRMANSGGDAHKFSAALSSGAGSHQDFVSDYVLDDGDWCFVGMSFSMASTNVKLYVNGLLNKTIVKSTAIAGDSLGSLDIGREHKWNEYANVVVDDVRIFNRELSDTEVLRIYHNSASGYANTSVIFRVSGGIADIERLNPKGDIGMGTFTSGP
jgi:hypothetical protein